MKQKWDSETTDLMITEIERLEAENTTLRIGYAKYIARYRPGDELWSPQDQTAMDLACGQ